jgi:hypothetical protein
MHADEVRPAELLVSDLFAHGKAEGLGAAARQRVEAGLTQRDEYLFP